MWGAILGFLGAYIVASMQTQAQKETNEQNVELQHEAWENQSITHRVEELEANGLNKQLATGMNPNYSLQTAVQSPMSNLGNIFDYFKSVIGSDYQIQQKKNAEIQNEILSADKSKAEAEALIAKHDAEVITKREGVASNDPAMARLIPGIGDMIFGSGQTSEWLRGIGDALKSAPEKIKHKVYEETPEWAKPFVFGNEYSYEKKGGVLPGAKYSSNNVVPKPVDTSQFASNYHRAKNMQRKYGRN